VLSCTLADAESLTQQLDPEDCYDLMQTFRATALSIITVRSTNGLTSPPTTAGAISSMMWKG
jgi:hypothetical protein